MLQRWADEILAPAEVPWQTHLQIVSRHAVAWRDTAVDHRYDAPSRRQAGIGYGPGKPILPRFRMPVPNVDFIFDTSGSMSSHDLGEAAREANGIMKQVGANVRVCACDAHAGAIKKCSTVQEAVAMLTGGGGTDMRPAFDEMMKQRPRPEVIIVFTDGHVGDGFPHKPIPGVRVIICLIGAGAPDIPYADWATTVRVTSAKKAA